MEPRPNRSPRATHLFARWSYLGELVANRRVLVLGNADAELADHLDSLEPRDVLCVHEDEADVELARRASRARVVDFTYGRLDRPPVRPREFDVVIVDDLSAVDRPDDTVAAAKRALAPRGVLVASSPNDEAAVGLAANLKRQGALDYYEFYGKLAAAFPYVRVVAQCPIVGYVHTDLSAEDPEPPISFDSSMVDEGMEEAEFYVALCSSEPIEPDPFAVVQLPLDWVALAAPPPRRASRVPAMTIDVEELAKARQQIGMLKEQEGELRGELDMARGEMKTLKLEMDRRAVVSAQLENERNDAREKASVEHTRVVEAKLALQAEKKRHLTLQKELEMARGLSKISDTERERAKERQEKLAALEPEVEGLRKQVEALEKERDEKLAALGPEVEGLRKQVQTLEKERDEATVAASLAEGRIAGLERRLAEATSAPAAADVERIAELERAAAEAAADAERLREQLEELEVRPTIPAGEMEQLQRALNEARAEAEGLRGRVSELEGALLASVSAGERAVELDAELQAARAEAEELRARLDGAATDASPRGDLEARHAEEVTRLEESLRERGGEVRRLQEELDRQSALLKQTLLELERVRGGGAAHEAGDGAAEAQVDPLRQRLEALETSLADKDSIIRGLEGELANRRRELGELGRKLDEAEGARGDDAEAGRLREQLEAAQSRVAELGREVEASKKRIEELSGEASHARAEASWAKEGLEEARQMAERARAELAALRARLDEQPTGPTTEQLDEVGLALSAERAERVRLERDLAEARSRLEAREASSGGGGAAQAADVPAEVERLEKQLDEQARELARVEGVALGQSFVVGDLERALVRAQRRVGELEFVRERLEECAERMDDAEVECARLRRDLAGSGSSDASVLRAELERFEAEVESARAELGRPAGAGARFAVVVVDQEAGPAAESASVSPEVDGKVLAEVAARLEELEGEREMADQALDRVVTGLSAAAGDTEALTELLAEREDRIGELEEELAALRARVGDAAGAGAPGGDEEGERPSSPPPVREEDDEFRFDLVRQLDSARRVVSGLEADKRRLAAELDQRAGDGKDVEAGIRDVRRELEELAAQADQLRRARRELSERAASLEDGLWRRGRRIEQLEAELAGERGRAEELEAAVSRLKVAAPPAEDGGAASA